MKNEQTKLKAEGNINLMHLQNQIIEQYLNTKEAMIVLGIKSQTTIGKYETEGKLKAYRPFSNRKRYKLSELLKIQSKR
ncbi:hypothetical protein DOS84_05140 [Flavobacterium aquariorum]|uniref:DNA-binding protein n=1 Tax=Flavobacterium aquariorum TaxID=2217670 RepID=A0A2W7UNJ4_9FLAO|nr:hypothetical protein [Flavobacterium aquariorum]PZX94935.1 hypothetical protein DOS84_05140 [Flavobacterium aquariorum]